MANRNTLGRRNEAARQLAKQKTQRSDKRRAAKELATKRNRLPMRVRLGLTKS